MEPHYGVFFLIFRTKNVSPTSPFIPWDFAAETLNMDFVLTSEHMVIVILNLKTKI